MTLLGERLGELQLIRLIGKGATARVFLASDGQQVRAVKVFPASSLSRAERELELGRDLLHANLNRVEALHDLQGQPALVMPFVRGTTLSAWLQEHDDPREFLKLMPGLLDALTYLAERGIVHRDLKPENLIVTPAGPVILVDYDLATKPGSSDPPARVAGTLAFLSPEQASSQPVSPASDLYSLGVLLYWGVCREVPFSGEPAEVIVAHRSGTPPRVSELRPELAGLDALVAGLLAKDAAARPTHAQVSSSLQRLLAGCRQVE